MGLADVQDVSKEELAEAIRLLGAGEYEWQRAGSSTYEASISVSLGGRTRDLRVEFHRGRDEERWPVYWARVAGKEVNFPDDIKDKLAAKLFPS